MISGNCTEGFTMWVTEAGIAPGDAITMTATAHGGDTSEFSVERTVRSTNQAPVIGSGGRVACSSIASRIRLGRRRRLTVTGRQTVAGDIATRLGHTIHAALHRTETGTEGTRWNLHVAHSKNRK